MYELIDEELANKLSLGFPGLSISEQCKILGLSRSGYYQWKHSQQKQKSKQAKEDLSNNLNLLNALLDTYNEQPACGYQKMAHTLQNMGFKEATEKRIRLLYKKLKLRGAVPVFKTTRMPKGKLLKFPYLLKDKPIAFVNQVWATDITYIKVGGRMMYLTAVIDLFSRKILSYKIGESMATSLCLDVLYEAIAIYGVPAIFNTDCGSQYLSKDFIEALKSYHIEISNDSIGRCLDNIIVERTWKTIKYECVFIHDVSSKQQLDELIGKFVRIFNSRRLHQGLGYQTPDAVYYAGCFPQEGTEIKTMVVA